MVEVLKKIVKKDDKTFINLYLELESGKQIPISVKQVKVNNEVKNSADFSILCAIAKKVA